MQKTKEPIYLPLSNEALKWMPEREDKAADDPVFNLPSNINQYLRPWAEAAGITKRFTFHTARHTFATMMLTLGADLYTVSKLLGHTSVRMTQVYAKIINQKKTKQSIWLTAYSTDVVIHVKFNLQVNISGFSPIFQMVEVMPLL